MTATQVVAGLVAALVVFAVGYFVGRKNPKAGDKVVEFADKLK
jgi:hypothetical protein